MRRVHKKFGTSTCKSNSHICFQFSDRQHKELVSCYSFCRMHYVLVLLNLNYHLLSMELRYALAY